MTLAAVVIAIAISMLIIHRGGGYRFRLKVLHHEKPGACGMDHNWHAMNASADIPIPNRAETLKVLRLMGDYQPILMLGSEPDGYGTRWTLDGSEVSPAIATYLMKSGFVVDAGATQMGAKRLVLTEAGVQFRTDGLLWWAGLGLLGKLKAAILG